MQFDERDRLIAMRDLKILVSLSETTINRLEQEGRFPCRIQVTEFRVAWRYEEVRNWIKARSRRKKKDD